MNVVITGSSEGIGRAIADKFLNCGHTVFGIDIKGPTLFHTEYKHFICDILHGELPELPPADILINNAGVQNSGDDIGVNLRGTIRVTEKFGIHDRIKSVLFIASASARTGSEFPE